jgi:uncharacterized protein YcbK (DUF882 family)
MFTGLLKNDSPANDGGLSRRGFLKAGVLAIAACAFPGEAMAVGRTVQVPERFLCFCNTHTGERLSAVYHDGAGYLPDALLDINRILRDHRTGEILPIDVRLLDLLFELSTKLEARRPFHIISGYRSGATNALLSKRNRGVVRNSLHVLGKAVDVRLPGCKLTVLRKAATALRGGGVGYYARSDFLHLDVGRVRYW